MTQQIGEIEMKVKFLFKGNENHPLTLGKEYTLLSPKDDTAYYHILDDNNEDLIVSERHFRKVVD